jgi:hypothetical protein
MNGDETALRELLHRAAPDLGSLVAPSSLDPTHQPRHTKLIPVGAVVAAVAALAVVIGLVGHGGSNRRTATTSPPSLGQAPARLLRTTWALNGLDDPSGTAASEPDGESQLIFSSSGGVSDGQDDAAGVDVRRGTMTFTQPWVNDAVGVSGHGLRGAQESFVFRVLSGTVEWKVARSTLTIRHPGVGTLTYTGQLLTAQLVLDRTRTPANGQPIDGELILSNNTGKPIVITNACDGWYALGLSNDRIQRFEAAYSLVLCARDQLPVGITRQPITLSTRYQQCAQPGGTTGGTPPVRACTGPNHSTPPPLPPGRYTTTLSFRGLSTGPGPVPPTTVTLTQP